MNWLDRWLRHLSFLNIPLNEIMQVLILSHLFSCMLLHWHFLSFFFWQNKCLVLFIHYIVTSNYFNNTPMTTNGITSQGPKPDFFLFLARDDRMIIFITVLALQFSIECLLCQSEVHERDWLLFDLCLCFSLSLRELENCSSICFLEKAKCWYLYDDTLILSLSRASL